MEFEPHYFRVLSKAEVVTGFPWLTGKTLDLTYREWLASYVSKASMFYGVQLRNHQEREVQVFYREHELEQYESIPYYLEEEANLHFDKTGVRKHIATYDNTMTALERLHLEQKTDDSKWMTSDDGMNFYKEMIAALIAGETHPYFLARRVDELWFDTVIETDEAQAKTLRTLPYNDYLKTPHWLRVRAAMLLIHRCRCQGKNCIGTDGYWMGDEDLIHVHHMTYKNRGKERCNDLRLLCSGCHERLHTKGIDAVLDHPEANLIIS